jgi:alpha-glucosidase
MGLKIITCTLLLFLAGCIYAQKKVQLVSPDENIVFTLQANNNIPSYSVTYKKNSVIADAAINLVIEGLGAMKKVIIKKTTAVKEVNENYTLAVGKVSVVNNHYRQTIISLQDNSNTNYKIAIEVRVFNDGVAFRYLFPKQKGKTSFTLLDEKTEFKFTADPVVKALPLPNFTTSHEGFYITTPLSKIKEDTLLDMPALLQLPNKIFLAITEAALLDYAGMYLVNHNGILQSRLSPLPNQAGIKVKAQKPLAGIINQ